MVNSLPASPSATVTRSGSPSSRPSSRRRHPLLTSISSPWLNLVERFFRDLTDFITARSFASVGELSDAIIAFLAERNKNAKRYVWHAKGEDILRKIEAARQAMARNEASEC